VYLPYSDATLFGLLIQGSTPAGVKEAGKTAVAVLKASAQGIKAEELKSAVAKAKFAAASVIDTREGLVNALGSKVCLLDLLYAFNSLALKIFGGTEASLESTLSSLDSVSAAALSKVGIRRFS
jgi:ubiquinol-cytochrome c reductase core subunit 2